TPTTHPEQPPDPTRPNQTKTDSKSKQPTTQPDADSASATQHQHETASLNPRRTSQRPRRHPVTRIRHSRRQRLQSTPRLPPPHITLNPLNLLVRQPQQLITNLGTLQLRSRRQLLQPRIGTSSPGLIPSIPPLSINRPVRGRNALYTILHRLINLHYMAQRRRPLILGALSLSNQLVLRSIVGFSRSRIRQVSNSNGHIRQVRLTGKQLRNSVQRRQVRGRIS